MKRRVKINGPVRIMASALSACMIVSFLSGPALARSLSERAREYYLKGSALYGSGDYAEANKYFTKSLELVRRCGSDPSVMAPHDVPVLNRIFNIPTSDWQDRQVGRAFDAALDARENMPEYLVGDGDVLAISIWQNPDLNQDAIVRPDGRISFPLIGDVTVGGKTLPQIDSEVTAKLAEFIKFPEVSIYVKALGGGKVIVLGEVRIPGVYYVTGRKSVLEAIALAQGLNDTSLASSIVVVKAVSSKKPHVVRVSANLALKGDSINNIMLESDDVVFVPKKPVSDAKWFLDNVWNPFIGEITTLRSFFKMDR